jgi:hypothetical protein
MGDLLLELDPAEARADAASAQDALNASLAEAARRRYAIDAVRAGQALETRGEREQRDGLSGKDAKDTDDASEAAELSPIEKLAGQPELTIAWDEGLPEPFRLREEAVLRADLMQLSDVSRFASRYSIAPHRLAGHPSEDADLSFHGERLSREFRVLQGRSSCP